MFARQLSPELLDDLAPTHPDAMANRRDLASINRLLGNFPWISKAIAQISQGRTAVLELGAGEGDLAAHLHRHQIPSDGIDLWPRPAAWPAGRQWWRHDLRTFSGYADYEIVVGNFIFHQFSDATLADLGQRLRQVRAIVACEPARSRRSQFIFAVVGRLLRANRVTLHDGHVSIAGGFLAAELPLALGLDLRQWQWTTRTTFRGMYRMVAVRRS